MDPVVLENSILRRIQLVQNLQYTSAILNAIYCK